MTLFRMYFGCSMNVGVSVKQCLHHMYGRKVTDCSITVMPILMFCAEPEEEPFHASQSAPDWSEHSESTAYTFYLLADEDDVVQYVFEPGEIIRDLTLEECNQPRV